MIHDPITPGATIGILDTGQLGKMSLQAAHQLGYHTAVYAPEHDAPAMEIATHRFVYDWIDLNGIDWLLNVCDVITAEWENVPLTLIEELERRGAAVRPSSRVLEVAQSRIAEKAIAESLHIPTTKTVLIKKDESISDQDWSNHLPGILKTDRQGYDGKGQHPVDNTEELDKAFREMRVDCVLEKRVDLACEISVLVARTADGNISVSDIVENYHSDGILNTTVWPLQVGDTLTDEKKEEIHHTAMLIAMLLGLKGVLCLEFFVDKDHNVLFNEMAPRPHNSFHGSIEAAYTSQFEQHIRAICGLPLGNVKFHTPFTMTNLIGGNWEDDWAPILNDPSCRLHLYGKSESRPGRKMGHTTCLHR